MEHNFRVVLSFNTDDHEQDEASVEHILREILDHGQAVVTSPLAQIFVVDVEQYS